MKSLFSTVNTVMYAFITTMAIAISFTFAQPAVGPSDFIGDVSVRVFCTFNSIIPGGQQCESGILVNDVSSTTEDTPTNTNGQKTLSENKANQITNIINRTINGDTKVVYVPGPKGADGKNGTTTIVYQTTIAGAANAAPTAYVYPGNPAGYGTPAYQTTVPGDIHSTFIHFFQFETAKGNSATIGSIDASSTNTTFLNFGTGTGVNLTIASTTTTLNLLSTNATITNSSSTNLFANYASITEATTTNIYSLIADFVNLFADYATITNATATNLFAKNASFTSATATNVFANYASITAATSTDLFSLRASITEATTTYFFAAFANFLNLFVENLTFKNATGTNLQVANASTTNLTATGTTNLTNAFIASSTQFNSSINSGNATLTTIVAVNSTITNAFVNFASITNSTSTNLFSKNASLTNATTTNLFSASANVLALMATNATLTNATITNLRVENCAEGNVICNGGNDTGVIVGTDAPLVVGTLNAGNINFITGDLGAPSVTPGAVKLTIETGLPAEGSGAVRVTNSLKVGADIIASGTATVTNLVATGTFKLATGTIASTTVNWLNVLSGLFVNNATITNATTTNLFAAWFKTLNASIDNLLFLNATGTNLQLANLSTTNINATGTATITNAVVGNATTTNLLVNNNLVAQNISAQNATTSNLNSQSFVTNFATSTWMYAQSGIIDFATSTVLFASKLNAVNATTSTLFSNIGLINTFNSFLATVVDLVSTNATITNATTTNLFATNASITNAIANNLIVNNFTATGTTNIGTTTVYGSLIPNASTTYHNLGSLTNPWHDLYLSPSTIYLGTNTLKVVDGILTFGGSGFALATSSPTATSTFGVLNASTTLTDNLLTINATNTNLFATWFTAINAMVDNLVATNATLTNATTTNLFANWFKATNASIDSLTTVNLMTGNINATGTINSLGLNATNATITLATITNLEVSNFLPGAQAKIASIATGSTLNSLTFSTTTNILESIVNGKISTTSLASLAGGGGGGGASNSIRLTTIASTTQQFPMTAVVPGLQFSAGANEKWYVQVKYKATPLNFNNLAVGLSAPSSSTCTYSNQADEDFTSTVTCGGAIGNITLNKAGTLSGIITTGANSGNISVVFAKSSGGMVPAEIESAHLTAFRIDGADLAEVYYAQDISVEEGDVVALDGTGVSQVAKTNKKYQKNAIGIISTKPGVVMGEVDGTGKAVIVGLSGRVPVKVTDKNGVVKAGDFLTSSDVPGFAMKATAAGQVIGQALTDDAGTGKVMVFIKNTYHDGNNDEDTEETIADKFTAIIKNTLEKLSGVTLAMNLWVTELKANVLTANEVISNRTVVQELCVGSECFTESDMKEFRNYLNSKKAVIAKTEEIEPQETAVEPVAEIPAGETAVLEPVAEVVEPLENLTETPVTNTTEIVTETVTETVAK